MGIEDDKTERAKLVRRVTRMGAGPMAAVRLGGATAEKIAKISKGRREQIFGPEEVTPTKIVKSD